MAMAFGSTDSEQRPASAVSRRTLPPARASRPHFLRAIWSGGYVLPLVATVGLLLIESLLRGLPVHPLVWPVVALEAIAIVSALAVAALAAPRGWILRDRFQTRLATTFAALAINSIFFVLTYPGLRDGNAVGGLGLLSSDSTPSYYF